MISLIIPVRCFFIFLIRVVHFPNIAYADEIYVRLANDKRNNNGRFTNFILNITTLHNNGHHIHPRSQSVGCATHLWTSRRQSVANDTLSRRQSVANDTLSPRGPHMTSVCTQ